MASIPKFTRQELEKFILSSWDTSVAEYWRILSNDEIDFSERRMGIRQALNDLATGTLAWAMKANRIRTGEYDLPHGYEGSVRVGFMESPGINQLYLTVWDGDLVVECNLQPEASIPNQDDAWWATISEIAECAPTALEGFCLQRTGTKEQKNILKSGRAIAFQIARNYSLTQLDPAQGRAQVGSMNSSIPLELGVHSVMEKVKHLVRLYAKINQGLHRSEYLKYKAQQKRRAT